MIIRIIKTIILNLFEFIMFVPLLILCFLARYKKKPIDIGIGPEPLINNVYHKKALEAKGFTCETFVNGVYFITDQFDIRADLIFSSVLKILIDYYLFLVSIFKYKCLYFYFNGGSLGHKFVLWRFEPFFYKIAKVKVVVMPYGGDVHELSRCPNNIFKHTMSLDYPNHRFNRKKISKKIDLWTKYARHVISGCDWVDYMYYWDTLMLGHFSIDTDLWNSYSYIIENKVGTNRPFKILHAPNHRNIKGSQFVINTIKELQDEGYNIELIMLEKVPNDKIRQTMASIDLVIDQLIIGWYAMFAIEAMSMGKPVMCYLRQDLIELYTVAGLINQGEIPIINCNPFNIKGKIKNLIEDQDLLIEISKNSRDFVIKHHSLDYIGNIFAGINNRIGIH